MSTNLAVANQTAQRLALSLKSAGKDALQPSAATLALPWAQSVLTSTRVGVILILKAASGSGPGFDYGPVQLTPLRWITINRLAKLINPDVVVKAALAGEAVTAVEGTVPPVKRKPTSKAVPAAPVATPAAPVVAAPTVAPATPPAAPVAPPAAPVVDWDAIDPIVTQPVVPPDVVAAATSNEPYVCPAEKAHPEWDWREASVVFGVPGVRGKVAVWPRFGEEGSDAKTGEVDPHFEWHVDHLQWAIFAAGETPAKGIWMYGNRGSGKTEFCTQFAAYCGRPFYKVTFSQTMEPSDFLGDMGAAGGSSEWQDGVMLQALQSVVPAVILLDEISYAQSSHISGPLNEIIHTACAYNVPRTGKRIRFNPSHFFLAGDNTNGTGDISGLYEGVKKVNRATMDRFGYFNQFTYLPKALEVRLLKNKTFCNDAIAEKVWGLLNALRLKVASGNLSDPPSLREGMAMASAMRSGLFTDKACFESAFVAKYPEDIQEDVRVTFTAVFDGNVSA